MSGSVLTSRFWFVPDHSALSPPALKEAERGMKKSSPEVGEAAAEEEGEEASSREMFTRGGGAEVAGGRG